jgi:XapX domain-containing protein
MKIVIGFLLGLDIGIACGFLDIPFPGFPALVGAMLVVAVTVWARVPDE